MTSSSFERRVAPRFAVRCTGELAAGTEAFDGAISDISVTGCCLDVADYPDQLVGKVGVLRMMATSGATAQSMMPVVVANHRAHGGGFRLGLQFGRLTMPQTRGLLSLMEELLRR